MRSFRGKTITRKIAALLLVPLVSLTAMWAFATYLTGREANQLLDVGNVVAKLGYPAEDAVQALQQERRQSLIYLADRRGANSLAALRERTRETDKVVAKLRGNADDPAVRDDLDGVAGARMNDIVRALNRLSSLRAQIEDNTISRDAAFEAYNDLVDPNYDFLAALHALENVEMDKQGRALVNVTRAREAVAREDALMSAAIVSGTMDKRDLRAFSDRVAERRVLYDTSLPLLPGEERSTFADYWRSAPGAELTSYEDRVIEAGPAAAARTVNAERWNAAAGKVLGDLQRMGREAGDRYKERVEPVATGVLLKAGVAGVLGFVALLVSVIVSVRIGSKHVRDLIRLRKAAHEVSGVRLPSVMRRLAAGEHVDVETEAPRLEFGQSETEQVGQALNTLQRAAVEAAVKQADMRRGVSEVFVNLARRSQVLLHRQLTLLDAMERRTENADELADLFRLDHLTTRMRRHAEGLVILSGAAPSRQWRKPIPLMDVVRAAVAEVEDYERIEVRRLPRLAVQGPAVSDLTHLIAELLENATVFSPPHTAVQVVGERVSNGFTLEIHDRGLGMAPDVLLDANLRLAETPEFELSDTDRLGLFVVSRLAQRQGVRVSLQPSPYGGTTAVVFIPSALLTEGEREDGADTGSRRIDGRRTGEIEAPGAKLAALAQVPVPLPEPDGRLPEVIDGRVEPEAPQDPAERGQRAESDDEDSVFRGRTGRRSLRDTARGTDREAGTGRARARRDGAAPVAPVPSPGAPEQHQQTRDQAPAGEGPAPLPRRHRPPVLVSDHGRPVDAAAGADVRSDAETDGDTDADMDTGTTTDAGPAPAGRPATTAGGLPRRVRQASLAPQLKAEPVAQDEPGGPAGPADDRDAEDVRARMASLQRGWQRGRRDNGEDDGRDGSPSTAPGTTSGGDGR
ncbi:histidine kinase [Streptomyces albofaciens JCM 4342]|uniref:nitrate- and nitrite sensing domain-containing protein n=1 Tax=Streptomyces albofaciens TaxID=66866 RepID=UPI00123AB96D|nr:nitrate- and nitrite sensing domain-containing protein [Streptomyces albofaciens]KAA6223301.1 histidine kinase [Streptomyces albofaciens JCM 4342]